MGGELRTNTCIGSKLGTLTSPNFLVTTVYLSCPLTGWGGEGINLVKDEKRHAYVLDRYRRIAIQKDKIKKIRITY